MRECTMRFGRWSRSGSALAGLVGLSAIAASALSGCGSSTEAPAPGANDAAGSSSGGSSSGGSSSGGSAPGGSSSGGATHTGAYDLTGSFAVQATIKAEAIIPVDTVQYFLSTFVQNGTHLEVQTRTCDIQLPSVPGVAEVIIPAKLQAVFREMVYESEGEFLNSTDLGASYAPPLQVVVLGAELDDPVNDPLPTEENLGTAIDQDNDGNPGVTVEANVALCSGQQELYVALRTGVLLDGVVEDSNTIAGEMDATLEQEVLGISDRCLNASSGIEIKVLPGSSFRALRIDGANGTLNLDSNGNGEIDCQELGNGITAVFDG
jgi:hypothetical protein